MPRAAHVSALEPSADSHLNIAFTTGHYAFPRHRRLTAAADYRHVFADNISVASRHLVLLARPNGQNAPRLGLAIAKKNLRRAVDRNCVKRAIRESFRLHRHDLIGIDIVVLARRGIDMNRPKALRCDLDAIWAKLNKKCKKLSQS